MDDVSWSDDLGAVDWDELSNLYRIAPLGEKPPDALRTVFTNSMFTTFARAGGTLVGAGRALADGLDCAYIADVAVHPDHQGRGLGQAVIHRLTSAANGHKKVILYANPGKEGFYLKLGFLPMNTAMGRWQDPRRGDRVRRAAGRALIRRAADPTIAAVASAARANAAWCTIVCAGHDIGSHVDERAWTSDRRSPALFPDAVTLRADVDRDELLSRVDVSSGCSVKDSFAALDLSPLGFHVLFDATWVGVAPGGPAARRPLTTGWSVARDDRARARWTDAWARNGGAVDVLGPAILRHRDVTVVATPGDTVDAGAVLARSDGTVGVSNVFAWTGPLDAAWAAALAIGRSLHPGAALVSYESGPALAAAIAAGWLPIGPLRVWSRGERDQAVSSSSP